MRVKRKQGLDQGALVEQGSWTTGPAEVPSNITHSVSRGRIISSIYARHARCETVCQVPPCGTLQTRIPVYLARTGNDPTHRRSYMVRAASAHLSPAPLCSQTSSALASHFSGPVTPPSHDQSPLRAPGTAQSPPRQRWAVTPMYGMSIARFW